MSTKRLLMYYRSIRFQGYYDTSPKGVKEQDDYVALVKSILDKREHIDK